MGGEYLSLGQSPKFSPVIHYGTPNVTKIKYQGDAHFSLEI